MDNGNLKLLELKGIYTLGQIDGNKKLKRYCESLYKYAKIQMAGTCGTLNWKWSNWKV